MNILLRKAEIDDLAKILEIVNEAIEKTTSNYNYEPQTIAEQTYWFQEKLKKNFSNCLEVGLNFFLP